MTECKAVKIISDKYVIKINENVKAVFKIIIVIIITVIMQVMKDVDITACLSVIKFKMTSADSEMIYLVFKKHAF